eukprot:4395723-Prymnesium_polylepis.1
MRVLRRRTTGQKWLKKCASVVPRVCVAAGRTRGCERQTRRFCSDRSTLWDVPDAWDRRNSSQRPAPRRSASRGGLVQR